ncbi:hypothetical protein OH407_24105, partial [Salmonella enterica]|uniref:hypothetical protein n=1 Tax=Salmonella enterica TaxID=28901 RepID=UPI0022B6F24F
MSAAATDAVPVAEAVGADKLTLPLALPPLPSSSITPRPQQPPAQDPSALLDELPSLSRDRLLQPFYSNLPYR